MREDISNLMEQYSRTQLREAQTHISKEHSKGQPNRQGREVKFSKLGKIPTKHIISYRNDKSKMIEILEKQ